MYITAATITRYNYLIFAFISNKYFRKFANILLLKRLLYANFMEARLQEICATFFFRQNIPQNKKYEFSIMHLAAFCL